MKINLPRLIVLIVVLGCTALVFVYPVKMISPGKLITAHSKLEQKCFSCHAIFRGTPSSKCIECHTVKDIGIKTSKGLPITKTGNKQTVAFHQKLTHKECLGCHTDHAGMKVYRQHQAFSHNLLVKQVREQCHSCHKKPDDNLHSKLQGQCAQCHSQTKWKPATFDHAKYFELDKDHDKKCSVCHEDNNFKTYTCYGCHAHSPASIREEHLEDGTKDFENCVECHTSADEDEAKRKLRKRKRTRQRGTITDEELDSQKD